MRTIAAVLVLCIPVFAQVSKPQSKPTKCQSVLGDELQRRMTAEAERDQLAAANKDLQTKLADMSKRYEGAVYVVGDIDNLLLGRTAPDHGMRTSAITDPRITAPAIQLIKDLNAVGDSVGQLMAHDSMAVDKYNALLADYRDYVQRVDIQLAQARQLSSQQQRFNNALALYSLMPKYQPPQTINLQVTNCNTLPALCVH